MEGRNETTLDDRVPAVEAKALLGDSEQSKDDDGDCCSGQQARAEPTAEFKRLQQNLIRARSDAVEASRTKSRFLLIMSHEIRTPLNGVLGALQLLADTDPSPGQRELIALASSSAESLRRVTNDVIDLSRLESGQLELELAPFDLAELLSDSCEFWRPMAVTRGLALQLSIDDDVPRKLIGDAARIRRIINNFVSNAINFTDQGSVKLNLALDDRRCSADGEDISVCLEIRDTGIGISRDDQKRLFRDQGRIQDTAGGHREGAGLGLAICHELAGRMGGSVGVSSIPEVGSVFWVRLPLRLFTDPGLDCSSSETSAELAPLWTAAGTVPHVILVEDSVTNQMIAQTFLTRFGCHVDVVDDGLEAVNAVKDRRYDVVLMDVAMPRMDGVEATRQIRAMPGEPAALPIVGQTAYALEEETVTFLASGMDAVVNKPLKRELLHGALSRALACPTNVPTSDAAPAPLLNDIDTTALDQLKDSLSVHQLSELLERVMIDIEANTREAVAGARAGELTRLAKACHTLKGLGGSFGNPGLEDFAAGIQSACRNDDAPRAIAMALSGLQTVCTKSLAALKAYRQAIQTHIEASAE